MFKYKIGKKGLGQNFLTDKNKIREIVAALEPKGGDTVIEIGPGHGELTTELLASSFEFLEKNRQGTARGIRLIAIEKDPDLVPGLMPLANQHKNLEIMVGDALKILPGIAKSYKLKAKNYKIVGNIPYYITGFLLRVLGELEPKPKKIVLTIQKEVAERIIARPPEMNLLAASVQFWAEAKISGIISKKDFIPQPKVDSAILTLTPKKMSVNQENYYSLIRSLFKQPRKTTSNNLLSVFKSREKIESELKKIGAKSDDRPQNLSVSQIERLVKVATGQKRPKTVKKSALI